MEEIETKRLRLRQWKLSDSADLFEYAKSEKVGPNAGWAPHKDEKESRSIITFFLKQKDVWAIELQSNNKVIGSIGLHKRSPDDAIITPKQREVGFVLHPAYWGKGYAPEAVKKILAVGFHEYKLEIIWCGHFDTNLNSQRVVEKCGFRYQFTTEKIQPLLDDKIVVMHYYNILKADYLAHTK